jgi:hypothetical protein
MTFKKKSMISYIFDQRNWVSDYFISYVCYIVGT